MFRIPYASHFVNQCVIDYKQPSAERRAGRRESIVYLDGIDA